MGKQIFSLQHLLLKKYKIHLSRSEFTTTEVIWAVYFYRRFLQTNYNILVPKLLLHIWLLRLTAAKSAASTNREAAVPQKTCCLKTSIPISPEKLPTQRSKPFLRILKAPSLNSCNTNKWTELHCTALYPAFPTLRVWLAHAVQKVIMYLWNKAKTQSKLNKLLHMASYRCWHRFLQARAWIKPSELKKKGSFPVSLI